MCISALCTGLAYSSGERLALKFGHPDGNLGPYATHAAYAKLHLIASLILPFALLAGFALETVIHEKFKAAELAAKIVTDVASIAVVFTSIVAGHEGAKLTWQDATPSNATMIQVIK